jgi:hypothetical protein
MKNCFSFAPTRLIGSMVGLGNYISVGSAGQGGINRSSYMAGVGQLVFYIWVTIFKERF